MSSQGDATLPATRRSRKSISGRLPSGKTGDKENATVDIGSSMAASRKKSRSKSMGPGGLDVLKSGAGNRRVSLAAPSKPPPRSILKPTIPLLPEIPPHKSKSSNSTDSAPGESNDHSGTKIALRTEEEQQTAAREREDRERAQLEKEIHDRREARRKSLANRRVSFAAEATLHTFHEVEYVPDNARRTSSAPRAQESQDSDPSEPPSTPPEQVEEADEESPANQRDLHQRKHRRSSGAASLYEDDTITSTVYDSDLEHADGVTEIHGEEMSDSSDSDEDDGTMMTVEAEEMTSASVATIHSTFGGDTTGDLDENLRLATQRAITQRVDEEEEVIAGFAGWGRKNLSKENITQEVAVPVTRDEDQGSDAEMTMEMDMDITNAVGNILKSNVTAPQQQDGEDEDMDMDMSMDVTKALGGIISQAKQPTRRKSLKPASQQMTDDTASFDDQTMEFTTVVGGIKPSRISDVSHMTVDSNEDMSMELTMAVGNVLASTVANNNAGDSRRRTIANDDDSATVMDMTAAVGRILPEEDVGIDEDETMGMDMTQAVGGIIKSVLALEARSAAKKIMEQEADEPDPSVTTSVDIPTSAENSSSSRTNLEVRGSRRTPTRSVPPVRRATRSSASPARKAATPTREVASPVRKPASPARKSSSPVRKSASPVRKDPSYEPSPAISTQTPPQKKTPPPMIGSRSSSPVRTASPIKKTPTSPLKTKRLFHQDPNTGASTPRVVLTPQGRPLSGVGADRPGLGSPKVTQIFDRRESIGDVATSFVPGHKANARRGVAFADPRVMEAEIDRERHDEEEREDGRRILQREANALQEGVENTLSLKEMIQGLSPKKNPLHGRKSLAVGSARGLLGKRPVELDDEEAEDTDGVKRLRGHQGSPVKNIRLQSPPSKAETTTGRVTQPSLRSTDNTIADTTVTPTMIVSPDKASTPRGQGRFRQIQDDQPTRTMELDHTAAMEDVEIPHDEDGERIHLQDFLNMTSIRFMELTTTKRRHTVAPNASRDNSAPHDDEEISLEKCVVAGACTVPMLELYQHSCRELKKYISEGRRIVREIETETFVENPPLFREYISASPEFKILMDSQFKNVKSHARLLSKAMWYEWRMKLQDGLNEGLIHIAEGMDQDDKIIRQQQELLAAVLPAMSKRVQELEQEHEDLEDVVRELSECDPAELQKARADLISMETAISEKTKKIVELRRQVEESEKNIGDLSKRKQQCLDEIKEADKIREECRGWSSTEISAIKARTDALEKRHGWAITGISGTTISMSYRREIELVFDIAAFQQKGSRNKSQQSPRIDIWYIAANRERNPLPSTPEKEFFIQCIRDHIRGLPLSTAPVKHLLGLVAAAWDKANTIAEQTRFLNLTSPTTVTRTSDTSVAVKSSLLLAPLQSRVEVTLNLHSVRGDGIEFTITPSVAIVYGEQFNVTKMTDFLSGRLSRQAINSAGEQSKMSAWGDAVLELHRKLLARGKKAGQSAGGK